MTKIVLVTGATGFVGRQVIRAMAHESIQLRLVVRKGTLTSGLGATNLESVVETSDLFAESQAWWEMTCKDVHTVIHIAWYVKHGNYLQSTNNVDCLIGTLNLAKACVAAGVKRFSGIGTCFEYDVQQGYLSVRTPLNPTTPYAAAKAAAFLMLSEYFSAAKVDFCWCRLFYLFGEGEYDGRLVQYIRKQLSVGEAAALTNGLQVRDFMDVADAGRAIARVALGNQVGPMNVCSGRGITIRELAERIADEYGRRDLLRFGARPDNLVDPPRVVGVLSEPDHR